MDALDRFDKRRQEGLIRSLVQRGVVTEADASKKMQTLNIRLRSGHIPSNVEHFERYGMTYNPQPGAEVMAFAVNGNPDHIIVTDVADRRYRMKNLAGGEMAIHDDQGQSVHLTRNGIVIKSGSKVRIEANVEIVGNITHDGNYNQNGVHIDSNGPHTA